MVLHPWLAIGLILAILGGLMLGLRFYQTRYSPHPEFVRKILHVTMGLLTIAFPWLFPSPLPVFILAGLAVTWLLALRFYAPLHQTLGSVLGGVGRRSFGEVYFPIAVAVVFGLSQGQPLLFCIPMLMLTLADATAALVGVRYGRLRYRTTDGQKSAEGSLTFFMVAFFSVHVPLLVWGETGRVETLLIGVILGLLVMLIEAIAWQGLDNLFIPIGGLLLLKTHLAMNATDLGIRLLVTIALVSFVLCWRRRTTLNDSALLGAALMGYLSWTLGGWLWLLSPLILFAVYPWLMTWINPQQTPLTPQEQALMNWLPADAEAQAGQWERVHTIYSVLSVCAAGFIWLGLFSIFDRLQFIYPYSLSFAANLAIVGIAGLSPVHYWHISRCQRTLLYSLKAWFLIFVPSVLLVQAGSIVHSGSIVHNGAGSLPLVSLLGSGLIGILISAIGYYGLQPWLRQRSHEVMSWLVRAICVFLGSLVGLGLMQVLNL